jgi:predicted transcriptional regulator of viral defense system
MFFGPCSTRDGSREQAGAGYLLIPPDQGPNALGESNLLALASRITDPYYVGWPTTQHRRLIYLVTPNHVRGTRVQDTPVRVVNLGPKRFFGFKLVDVSGYHVMMSDREKTVLDCIDRPALAGGTGETAQIFATAVRRFDWQHALEYLSRIHSASLARRVGFLTDHVKAELPANVSEQLLNAADRPGVSFFGPRKSSSNVIGYQGKWRLTVNVPAAALSESAGMGKQRTMKRAK